MNGGGTLVCTYWSGIVDEHDLCFLGGFPGPLRTLLGIRAEEIDALYPEQRNRIAMSQGNALGLAGSFEVRDLCDLVHLETAEALATYEQDFYAGRPAVTVNKLGSGQTFYLAARTEERFLDLFYGKVVEDQGLPRPVEAELPEGVSVTVRSDEKTTFLFVMNFAPEGRRIDLGDDGWTDAVSGGSVPARIEMKGYGVKVLRRPSD